MRHLPIARLIEEAVYTPHFTTPVLPSYSSICTSKYPTPTLSIQHFTRRNKKEPNGSSLGFGASCTWSLQHRSRSRAAAATMIKAIGRLRSRTNCRSSSSSFFFFFSVRSPLRARAPYTHDAKKRETALALRICCKRFFIANKTAELSLAVRLLYTESTAE